MKKTLSLILCMLCAVSMYAESVPHAVFFNSSGKFLFTYAEIGTYESGKNGVSAVFTGDQVVNSGSGNPEWYNWNGNVTNVVFDQSFASARPKSTANWFVDCNKLTSIVGMKEYLNTSEVTNMSHMFYKCTIIESIDVSGFNTSNVTDMSYMFANCVRLWSLNVSNFNTSKVENMSNMFQSTSLNSLNLSNFNTSKVKDMCMMFNNCSNITSLDLSSFDTSNVTDMSYMFANCILLWSLDVSSFDTSKVTNMECMFFGFFFLSSLDLSSFNTSSVTNMCKMFSGSNFSELDLSSFDTSQVTNMQEMFSSAGALENLDLSNFNTSNVTNMKNMFNYCTSLTTLNLTTFNTSSVTDMDGMFKDCSALTTIYCSDSWNAENSTNMFYGCESLVGASAYNSNNVTVAYANPTTGYFTNLIPHVIWCADNSTLYFQADGNNYGAGQKYKGNTITMVWNDRMGLESGIITATGEGTPLWNECNNAATVIFEESFAYVRPTSTYEWFLNFKNLTTITGLENLNTSATKSMYCMFTSCESLTSIDISTFDMSSIKSMTGMFGYCNKLETVNLANLDMSGVSYVSMMFAKCPKLTTIYCDNAWNFTDENSREMFDGCTSLVGASGVAYDANNINADYANPTTGYFTWTKSNVLCCDDNTTFYLAATDRYKVGDTFRGKTISSVWGLCDAAGTATPIWQEALKSTVTNAVIDESFADERPKYAVAWFEKFGNITGITGLSNLNTSEVTDMRFMFADCVHLTSLDLSTFNTSEVKDMTKMFLNCSELRNIYCSYNWNENTSIVNNSTDMFLNCTKLVGAVAYDANKITVAYANPKTGYFTYTNSNVFCCDDNTTFYLAATANYRVGDTFNGKTISSVWGLCDAAGTATPIWQEALKSTVTNAVIDESFADERPKYAVAWFENFTYLTEITGLSNLNTSEVTDMRYLFSNCVSLTSLDLSSFNTAKVTNMSKMFRHCEKLASLNLRNWDTSNLTDMNYMFQSCRELPTPDLSHFNTAAVKNMSGTFVDCQAFTALDLSTFNTSNVTTMRRMFDGCKATSLDLRSFNVSQVTDMFQMFRNCTELTTIFCDNTWNSNIFSKEMFLGCTNIIGEYGDTYNSSNLDATHANPLKLKGGYFTLTTESLTANKVDNEYWATYYNSYVANMADDYTTVYTAAVTSDGKYLNLTKVEDKVINKGQAVILKSTSKEINFTRTPEVGTGDFSNNVLRGNDITVNTPTDQGTIYTLANKDKSGNALGLGFYKYAGLTLGGRKAYLALDSNQANLLFVYDSEDIDNPTGVSNLNTENRENGIYYNLSGQRVASPIKGRIYIMNGKKILF